MQFLGADQKTQSSNSVREIPVDLLIDIFSRVPAKTIARLRCVSKLWRSILNRPDFTELFMTKSSTRPRLLLFSFKFEEKIYFFSSPQPENPNDNTCLVPTRYRVLQKSSSKGRIFELGSPLRGFICRRHMDLRNNTIVISNPVTGESLSLPKVFLGYNIVIRTYSGYNPIDKQLKVLCIKFDASDTIYEHQVLTILENGNHLWRTTRCELHVPQSNGICIDGILYYTAKLYGWIKVVCFDVRSEKFSFIDLDELIIAGCTLINYKGKVGVLHFERTSQKRLQLWVLIDAERCVWSKMLYTLPPSLLYRVCYMDFNIVGMTGKGEVVFSNPYIVDIFYIYYFNLESNRVTRIQIHGLEMFKNATVFTTLDYEENLKLMTEYI